MSMAYTLTYFPMGNRALLIEWPSQIDVDIIEDIWQLKAALSDDAITEYIVAYHSLTIVFSEAQKDFNPWIQWVQEKYAHIKNNPTALLPKKVVELPVYYSPEVAPDLEDYLSNKKISLQEMVHLHTKPEYTLFFYGFQPGFMYLGGLDKKLVQPRKDKPSAVVNSGSVAVGGAQTGIYPLASPGGWHIIGHCPLILFDPQLPEPCIAKPGDVIKFRAVEKNEYQEILDSLRDHKMLINH